MKKIGFGIIGLGAIAGVHLKAIADVPEAAFVAGYDVAPGRAEEFCKVHGGRAYGDLSAFLSDPDIDVVSIATPSGLHMESAIAACRQGKHLIVEKPLEVTTARCDAIIKAAADAGVKLLVVFPSRTFAAARSIHEAITGGRFGKIVCADAYVNWYRPQHYYDSGAWRGTWKLDGGGALMNQSIHAIDLLLWFMGDVEEVYAHASTMAHTGIEVEDVAAAALRFRNGAMGLVQGTTAAYPGFPKRIEIYGSEGSVIMEEERLLAWNFKTKDPGDDRIRAEHGKKDAAAGGASDAMAISHLGHRDLFASFVESLRADSPVLIDGAEGRRAVALIEAIYRSAREKRPVRM